MTPRREYTVGVEEELILLDPTTLAPAAAIEAIIAGERDHGPAKRELMQCQAEVNTGPRRNATELLEELVALRAELRRDAAVQNALVAAAGTHPFSIPEGQPITAAHRYRELVAALRLAARRTLCFAMHVHVAVTGNDKAMQLMEAIVPHLPVLLAPSTSSPFYAGEESGLASTRLLLLQNMPRTGLPPIFESYLEFQSTVTRLVRAGAIADYTYLWWDIRPQPRIGTLEVRIMDVQPSVHDSAALAGLVQALVRHYGRLYERGAGFPRANRLVVGENRWLAARHGLRAPLVSDSDEAVSARTLVADLLDRVEDDARALGNEWALERVSSILADGASSDRQVGRVRAGESVGEVLRALVDETAAE